MSLSQAEPFIAYPFFYSLYTASLIRPFHNQVPAKYRTWAEQSIRLQTEGICPVVPGADDGGDGDSGKEWKDSSGGGATAAIGVGATVGVGAALGLAFYVFKIRNQEPPRKPPSSAMDKDNVSLTVLGNVSSTIPSTFMGSSLAIGTPAFSVKKLSVSIRLEFHLPNHGSSLISALLFWRRLFSKTLHNAGSTCEILSVR